MKTNQIKLISTLVATLALTFAVSASGAEKAAAKKAVAPAAAKASYSRNYGMAGCGLGSMVMGKQGGQIFAATTNGTFASQMFGITFGTLNCEDDPNAVTAQRMDSFIAANKAALAGDIARGGGETVNNLSAMLGCADQAEQVGVVMQENFGAIFPNAQVYPNEVTDSIISVIRGDRSLAGACGKIA